MSNEEWREQGRPEVPIIQLTEKYEPTQAPGGSQSGGHFDLICYPPGDTHRRKQQNKRKLNEISIDLPSDTIELLPREFCYSADYGLFPGDKMLWNKRRSRKQERARHHQTAGTRPHPQGTGRLHPQPGRRSAVRRPARAAPRSCGGGRRAALRGIPRCRTAVHGGGQAGEPCGDVANSRYRGEEAGSLWRGILASHRGKLAKDDFASQRASCDIITISYLYQTGGFR